MIIVGFSQNHSTKVYVMNGSDPFLKNICGLTSNRIEYPDYQIILKEKKNSTGEKITVISNKSKDTIITIDAGPIYFYGVYKKFLFIDKGTGSIRKLIIFNLKDRKFIDTLQYENSPKVQSDSIIYDFPFPLTKEILEKFNNCPDSIKKLGLYGYSEKRIYDLHSLQSIKTGVIKCEYRE